MTTEEPLLREGHPQRERASERRVGEAGYGRHNALQYAETPAPVGGQGFAAGSAPNLRSIRSRTVGTAHASKGQLPGASAWTCR
jgi:hypothetical protein